MQPELAYVQPCCGGMLLMKPLYYDHTQEQANVEKTGNTIIEDAWCCRHSFTERRMYIWVSEIIFAQ